MTKTSQLLLLLGVLSLGALCVGSTDGKEESASNSYKIKALKIPANIEFCGEKIPLYKKDIKERVDRELLVNTYWQSNALLLIKRSHKYFPIIEPILKENGIPNDFKYLAVIESGLMNVTSSAGAKGFWQLIKETAKEKGLEVNENVDERYHIEKATKAACEYLLHSKELFGSWTLAAAAYNAGNRGIQRQINKQKVNDYYDLLLAEETQRYIPRIIAIKEIISKPNVYGFYFDKEDLYELTATKTVTVDTVITNIADFAKKMNTNYKELKIQNPWLRENRLNNKSKKIYQLKIEK